ncbi:uncharacterized protein PHACADRAFT_190378 [Phanerochaete carnosa HHB-10118-sp]|uniref:Uncharacterized protein n=1 Tax=Phanerochaete carnosa (strain HHB-10118-sp) TaxID=650164 RepID=K5XDW3_PHACS|nr:uncharacterized protein PHACADRAFT_190378 [Phanerochaete carnosa HHB-10118-sp]EKM61227.1 hypothetical protein PHACADRAFT_190378 [Phanerochaete carnosa HHB-10118-sp]
MDDHIRIASLDQSPLRYPTTTARPLTRHKTSLALTELASPRSLARSGYQTPRAERVEDPFSLGGFFPPRLAGTDTPRTEWSWLRGDEMDATELQLGHSDERLELEQFPTFDKAEDEETGRVIRHEDKLGVLSLRSVFSSSEAVFSSAYDDHLSTSYSDDLPEDSDALYNAYCDLRRAHTLKIIADETKAANGSGGLFSPAADSLDETS